MDDTQSTRLSAQNLRGHVVIAADGQVVGVVTAVFVNIKTWQVESLQLRLGDDIADQVGAERGEFHAGALEIPIRMIQSVGDTAILSVGIAGLREALAENCVGKTAVKSSFPESLLTD